MRTLLPLILFGGCVTQDAPSNAMAGKAEVALPNAAQGAEEALGNAAGANGQGACRGEQDPTEKAKLHRFMGEDTGAWALTGRHLGDGSFFVSMGDTNRYMPGEMFVAVENRDGRSTEIMVTAFGADNEGETFDGPTWEKATSEERAVKVKAAIVKYAQKLNGRCGARISSLDEELATFEKAFKLFDRREP
jgi:hypothetical protein